MATQSPGGLSVGLSGVRRAGAVPRGAWLLFLPGEFSAWPPSLLEAPPPWSAASSSRYLILGLCKREGGAWPCPALGNHPEAKAGVCPSQATDAVNCTVGCQSDGDCESILKCCPAACGKACQKPDEKPGTCPPVDPGIPMLGICANQCKSDANCSGIQKCCRNGCGKVTCMTPIH
uniref:WAP four-disulfide core domain 2 n=1 Tax=Cyanoderma ruficeps TaxID=181631 RepID=A0A8C3QS56_9PASS